MVLFKKLAVATVAMAAFAAPMSVPAATTTVTKVHGPLKILPGHKRKYCRTHWVHHRRVKKCWYH